MNLRVGIVGCGLVGRKRAAALEDDELVGCVDVERPAAAALAAAHAAEACGDLDALLTLHPDVVVVATPPDRLVPLAERALAGGSHVLGEKQAGVGTAGV